MVTFEAHITWLLRWKLEKKIKAREVIGPFKVSIFY